MRRSAVGLICGLGWMAVALADPTQGSFAGHTLGERYHGPVAEEQRQRAPSGLAMAIEPVTEDLREFTRVEVMLTPSSHTIAEVWAVRDLDDAERAQQFYDEYFELLRELYLWPCPPIKHDRGTRVQFMCEPPTSYLLTLERLEPEQAGAPFRVRLGLTLERRSAGWPELQERIRVEASSQHTRFRD